MRVLALAGAVLVALAVLAGDLARTAAVRHISRVTGITFPRGCTDVDVRDDGEFYVAAHVRLPLESLEAFLQRHPFRDTSTAVGPWMLGLRPENRAIPEGSDTVWLEGRSGENAWSCALDRSTGRLWIVVFYPDPGGTPP